MAGYPPLATARYPCKLKYNNPKKPQKINALDHRFPLRALRAIVQVDLDFAFERYVYVQQPWQEASSKHAPYF